MASLSFTTPKSVLVKIADMFQNRVGAVPNKTQETHTIANAEEGRTSTNKAEAPSKLNISLSDLKTISTALLHYRRSLAKMGETERAQGVSEIDKRFYDMILSLEAQQTSQQEAFANAA